MWLGLNLTQWIVIAVIVGLLAYDVIVGKIHQPTESTVIRDWGWKFNTFAFTAGFLIGHWFLPRKVVSFTAWGYALPILGGLMAFDIFWMIKYKSERRWFRWPGWWALIGIPCGMFLWGQRSGQSPF